MADSTGLAVADALDQVVKENAVAAVHCLAAAERAVEEGRFNIAKVLRAFAHSARLRALAAARVLALDRRPAEVLATCRAILQHQALDRENVRGLATELPGSADVRGLSAILHASAGFEEALDRALRSLEANRDVLESDVAQSLWGCQVCGTLIEGARPDGCPHCGALSFEFDWFGPFYTATAERLGRRSPAEIIHIVADSPRRLTTLLDGISEEGLARRPSADEWGMKEIAGHIVDVTELFCWRVRTILDAAAPPALDASRPPWRLLEGKGYAELESSVIADRFSVATREALGAIEGLGPREWGRYGFNRGYLTTVLDVGTWLANHNIAHFAQIAALREALE